MLVADLFCMHYIFIDRESGDLRLVASLCLFVCLFVCVSKLSCLNRLTFDLDFWREFPSKISFVITSPRSVCVSVISCCFDRLRHCSRSPDLV